MDDAIRTGDGTMLGWYSARGGEIGDIPVKEAGTSLALVFREVDLADGSGAVPVQLMWSNQDDAPATRTAWPPRITPRHRPAAPAPARRRTPASRSARPVRRETSGGCPRAAPAEATADSVGSQRH